MASGWKREALLAPIDQNTKICCCSVGSPWVRVAALNQRSIRLDARGIRQLVAAIKGNGHILVKRHFYPSHLYVAKDLDR